VDGDGDVDIRDVRWFARWRRLDALRSQYDMDADDDIDIRDVQLVFAQWPRVCDLVHSNADAMGNADAASSAATAVARAAQDDAYPGGSCASIAAG
jgi:hypothetical protein